MKSLKLIKNPDFTDWTNNSPDGWDKGNINPENSKNFYNVSIRRVWYFKIFGIRFNIKGRKNLMKPKFSKPPKSVKLTNKQKDLILDLALFLGINYKKALKIVKKVWRKFKK